MDGFLLINKAKGMTSHDVVYRVKRKLKIDKIGHTGTLDPFASGLLILCIGKATKLQSLFLNLDKSYEGVIELGKHYDTLDVTGTIVEEKEVHLKEDDVLKGVLSFNRSYEQLPPMYSALKVNGKKLYELARKGIEIERVKRLVNIYDFKMTSPYVNQSFSFFASVSKGTYVRSLASDLAEELNTLGALSKLNRLTIGNYCVEQAKIIEEVEISDIISLDTYFKDFPSIILSEYLIKLVKNGVYLDQRQLITDQSFIVKDQLGNMVAYYEVIGEHLYKPILNF
jgi:tRNA pseudouridine55 synthase